MAGVHTSYNYAWAVTILGIRHLSGIENEGPQLEVRATYHGNMFYNVPKRREDLEISAVSIARQNAFEDGIQVTDIEKVTVIELPDCHLR